MNIFCKLLLTIALVALSAPTFAKGAEPPLRREGKWTMDYAGGACNLSAIFGTGTQQVIAKFSQVAPEQALRLSLYGERLHSNTTFTRAQLTFLPWSTQSKPQEVTSGSVMRPDGKLPAVFVGPVRLDNKSSIESDKSPLPAVVPDIERSVNALTFRRSGSSFTLALGSMAPPMAAMRACLDDLVRHWGFEPAELATRQSRAMPIGNPAFWARSSDYPSSMISDGASAFVIFRVHVDPTGAVAGCDVLELTNPAAIGEHTCGLIKKRAKFTPSRDKDGKPVADYYINQVFWKMGS